MTFETSLVRCRPAIGDMMICPPSRDQLTRSGPQYWRLVYCTSTLMLYINWVVSWEWWTMLNEGKSAWVFCLCTGAREGLAYHASRIQGHNCTNRILFNRWVFRTHKLRAPVSRTQTWFVAFEVITWPIGRPSRLDVRVSPLSTKRGTVRQAAVSRKPSS